MPVVGKHEVMAALLAACALAACTGPRGGPLFGLHGVERAALDDCREPLQAKLCGGAPEAVGACWDRVAAAYEERPHTVARKRYLIDNGCPSPTVDAWLPDPR